MKTRKATLVAAALIGSIGAAGCHTITASAGTGGAISPSGSVRVWDGASQRFAMSPATGQTIADVRVDGAQVAASGDPEYTFTNVRADHAIDVRFVPVSSHYRVFDSIYSTAGSKLDGACIVCHQTHGVPTSTTPLMNGYGNDLHARTQLGLTRYQALRAVEGLDSDGDGKKNIDEIGARTFPGDPSDPP